MHINTKNLGIVSLQDAAERRGHTDGPILSPDRPASDEITRFAVDRCRSEPLYGDLGGSDSTGHLSKDTLAIGVWSLRGVDGARVTRGGTPSGTLSGTGEGCGSRCVRVSDSDLGAG